MAAPLPALTDEAHRRWRRGALLLAVVAVVTLSAGIGLRDPWPADEPRFALVARDMVRSGDWLFPRRNGELYADKPPLSMWLIALAYRGTGSLRLAFLLPSLLAGLGTLALVVDLARRLWSPRIGLHAGWALLGTWMFCWQSRDAQIDALLVGWTTLGFYGLCRHLLLGPAWGWYAIAALAMGAGVISKGVGFLPLLALAPWGALVAWRGWARLPPQRPEARWLLGLLILAPIAAWVVPLLLAVGDHADLRRYRDEILLHQTATRYASAWHHLKPWWFYLAQAPALWAPLALLLPWAVPAWWRRLRRGDPRCWLPLGFIVLVLAFFSGSPGKRGVYLYPTVPALALALAPLLPGLLRRREVRWILAACGVAAAVACLAVAPWWQDALVAALPAKARARLLGEGLDLHALGGVAVAIAVATIAWLAWGRLRRAAPAALGWWCCAWIILGWGAWPVLNGARYPAALMARAQDLAGAGGELGLVEMREQYVLAAPRGLTTFGYERPDRVAELRDALAWQAAAPRRFLLVRSGMLAYGAIAPAQAVELGRAHGSQWLLVPRAAVVGEPRAPAKAPAPASDDE
jgi:4-amino-4-deoxy-L-arabinose transferase-like glycosyltransferase